MVDAAHVSALLGTALFVSEDEELPDLVSKLSFIVGNAAVLLCKPGVYVEDCAQFWPPHFQEDVAELEEVLHRQLGQQCGHFWYWA